MINIGIFKKTLRVWIEISENRVSSKISINGNTISKIHCVFQKDGTLFIGDITPFKKSSYYCKGYGSMMMNELIRYAYANDISIITGNLASADPEHRDRLHSFYIKNGFKVIEYDNPNNLFYGEVIKKL